MLRWETLVGIVGMSCVVAACGPDLPRECGCLMSLGGNRCIEEAVERVDSLTTLGFEITESPMGRKGTKLGASSEVALYEGEVVRVELAAQATMSKDKRKRAEPGDLRPICVAARVELGADPNNFVDAGAIVDIYDATSNVWSSLGALNPQALMLRCQGGRILETSVQREGTTPLPASACGTKPATAAELAARKNQFKTAASGSRIFFQSGVRGTESVIPFTQAATPATRFTCGACAPQCPAGTCGADGCGGTCACSNGQPCVGGICQCVPQCPANACGADGCGGQCSCSAGLRCIRGSCTSCRCEAGQCGTNVCGDDCGGCRRGQHCDGGTCVANDPCTAPAIWCECLQVCMNRTFCRRAEDEDRCVD